MISLLLESILGTILDLILEIPISLVRAVWHRDSPDPPAERKPAGHVEPAAPAPLRDQEVDGLDALGRPSP